VNAHFEDPPVWNVELDSWQPHRDDATAKVICKQLGFPDGGQWVFDALQRYGPGKGSGWMGIAPVHMRNVVCSGSEPGIQYCAHDGWKLDTPYQLVGLNCNSQTAPSKSG